ncbi:MAG: spermidine acetyltransferase [Herbinix sp.]|jgi:diamine N-acetyltransferase|nr:spermidine acetyltransferase [Herbinix sp.]
MILLKPVDEKNFEEVIELKVSKDQESFVASNVFSIAQAKVLPECIPLAIYADEELVGFTMYALDREDKEYCIYRIMIDSKYQSKGYGRSAMEALINLIKADTEHHILLISFEPENERAKVLYESLGFVPEGRMIENEVIYKLNYV